MRRAAPRNVFPEEPAPAQSTALVEHHTVSTGPDEGADAGGPVVMHLGTLVGHEDRPADIFKTAAINADPRQLARLKLSVAAHGREQARRQLLAAIPRASALQWPSGRVGPAAEL